MAKNLFLIIFFISALVGCSTAQETTKTESTKTESTKTEVSKSTDEAAVKVETKEITDAAKAEAPKSTGAKFAGEQVVVAIFPIKNVTGEVKYDGLMFEFADSLESYFNKTVPTENQSYKIIPMQDVKDQIAALNIDLKGITYETKTWELAKLLGAEKIIWGTYYVKYEKAQIEAKVVDVKTKVTNTAHIAEKIKVPFAEALSRVGDVAGKLLPAMVK